MKKLKNFTRESLDVSQLMDPKEMGELNGGLENCEGGILSCIGGILDCHGGMCTSIFCIDGVCKDGGWFTEA